MKNILSDIRHTIVVTLIALVVLCGIYPVVVLRLGQTLFHYQAMAASSQARTAPSSARKSSVRRSPTTNTSTPALPPPAPAMTPPIPAAPTSARPRRNSTIPSRPPWTPTASRTACPPMLWSRRRGHILRQRARSGHQRQERHVTGCPRREDTQNVPRYRHRPRAKNTPKAATSASSASPVSTSSS